MHASDLYFHDCGIRMGQGWAATVSKSSFLYTPLMAGRSCCLKATP